MSQEKPFYVYVHRYGSGPKEGQVFYVGKGTGDRHSDKRSRNRHWENIVNKYGYTYEVLISFQIEACAFSFEMALIKHYGRDNLCNLTDGGEGSSGHISPKRKKVYCSNGMAFESTYDAAKYAKSTPKLISAAATGVSKTCGGFRWSYVRTPNPPKNPHPTAKRTIFCSNGMTFNGPTDAALWIGNVKANSHITSCCNEKRPSAYGFRWSYDNFPKNNHKYGGPKKVICTSDGICFKTVKDAALHYGNEKSWSSISAVCSGRRASAWGLCFEYIT